MILWSADTSTQKKTAVEEERPGFGDNHERSEQSCSSHRWDRKADRTEAELRTSLSAALRQPKTLEQLLHRYHTEARPSPTWQDVFLASQDTLEYIRSAMRLARDVCNDQVALLPTFARLQTGESSPHDGGERG